MFRSARELLGLSQEQVAALTQGETGAVSRTTVGDIERGRNLPGLETLVSLARVLHLEPGEVLERLDMAMTIPVDLTGMTREDLFTRAQKEFWSGDYRGALATYDAILEHLALDPPMNEAERQQLHAKIEIDRAVALRRCGALNAAQTTAERAIDLAQEVPPLLSEAYMVLAALLSQRGRSALAADVARRAVALSKRGDANLRAKALIQQGSVLHRAGKFEQARQVFVGAREVIRAATDRQHLAHIEGNIGACLMSLGRPKQARARMTAAVELARKHRVPAIEASWLAVLGRLALDDGQLDEAENFARASLRIAKPREHTLTIFRAEWLRHLIVRARNPNAPELARLRYLTRLYVRVKDNEGLTEVREFRKNVIDAADPERKR